MIHNAFVSVCMITYNQEAFIRQAIEGVLIQKCDFDYHLIICEDASTDKTGDICQQYADQDPQRVSYFRNDKNIGIGPNLFGALKKVSGEFIAFCEGDDYWTDPYKLQKQINFLKQNAEFNICYHKVRILLQDGSLVDDFLMRVPGSETNIDDLIRFGNYIHTASVVYRNNFTIPEWLCHCPIADYPLNLLSVRNGKIKYLDEFMSVYRFGVGMYCNWSSINKRIKHFVTINELIKNYPDRRIRRSLILKQRLDYLSLLKNFLFGKMSLSDLKFITSMFISTEIKHISPSPTNDSALINS
ncbi:MAG: glycosyltransferase [Candidatus Omnitrophica bacterium]|nr:glycosyltransferase [Candidatus Omnitrophota bacterium]